MSDSEGRGNSKLFDTQIAGSGSYTTSVTIDYISAAVNRHPRAAHASDDSLVAFGTSSLISLWRASDDENEGVYATLPGHEGSVTCIRFKSPSCFYSGDDKGVLKCWSLIDGEWTTTGTLQAHKHPVSALAIYETIIATGSSDSTVVIWKHSMERGEYEEVQKIDLKNRYPFDIHITNLPSSSGIVMALCGTERTVSIYNRNADTNKFVHCASLAGHEDWVKTLAFRHEKGASTTLMLASGSQDGTIRLWNIERIVSDRTKDGDGNNVSDDLLDSFEASLGEIDDAGEGGRQISLKRHVFVSKDESGENEKFAITFDALLVGHEAGVTSVAWRPSSSFSSRPTLMSTSIDSSLIHWSPTSVASNDLGDVSSIWINQHRFGDVGGQRLGGFVGGFWTRNGYDTLAWGWSGGWRRWRTEHLVENHSMRRELWHEINAVGGHIGSIRSISWSPNGEYLISTGPDQTSRIHGNIRGIEGENECWHEICRPQVHGYDLVDAAFLEATRFVSIADEKVARVFESSRNFVALAKHLGILSKNESEERPAAAAVPPLGLSNKAISEEPPELQILPSQDTLRRRPFEGELALSTLWPEVEKLFGHGYELHAIAVSHSKRLVAVSCRATTPEHAGIKLYDSQTWQQIGQTLLGHQLTITRIAFSPDDRYILSVSRDRTWCIFERTETEHIYKFVKASKSHSRIIWDCSWSLEGDIFVTASRDKTVRVWATRELSESKQLAIQTIRYEEATTAIAISASHDGRRLMAVGLENGEIVVCGNRCSSQQLESDGWKEITRISKRYAHASQINRLAWRPTLGGKLQLASCSDDGSLRILKIRFM